MKEEKTPLGLIGWIAVILCLLTAAGGAARVVGWDQGWAKQVDATTLTYFGVAGALLLLRNLKSLSFGDFKVELKEVAKKAEEALEEAKTASSAVKQGTEASALAAVPPANAARAARENDAAEAVSDPMDRPAGTVPDDPWKGQFGGNRENNQRILNAEVTPVATEEGWYRIRLWVESTDKARPLGDNVRFFVHPTFGIGKPLVKVLEGRAELRLKAWGAFTVGALADGGATALEYDLSEDMSFPRKFREG